MNSYYYKPARTTGSRYRRLWFITAFAVAVVALDAISGGWVRSPLWFLEEQWSGIGARIANQVAASGMLASDTQLAADNQALREQVETYRTKALAASALEEQNAALAATVHLALVRPGVTAPILSPESTMGTFLVGAGRQDGIASGDIVRADDGYAIATVISVQETVSLCRSIFSPESTIGVTVNDSHFELQGRGSANARGKAPRDADIHVGDVAVAGSLRGYPVGIVGAVEQDSAGAFQQVYVRTPQSTDSLRYVYIERP